MQLYLRAHSSELSSDHNENEICLNWRCFFFFKYFWTVNYYNSFFGAYYIIMFHHRNHTIEKYSLWHVILIILLKVSRVLPDWLSSPNVIASDLKQKTTLVSEFKGLDPDIHLNLKENKIDYFFPGIYLFFYC